MRNDKKGNPLMLQHQGDCAEEVKSSFGKKAVSTNNPARGGLPHARHGEYTIKYESTITNHSRDYTG